MRVTWICALLLIAGLQASAQDAAHKDCMCRANQQKYEQGQVACIRGQMARCEMVLNNPSWKLLSSSCPEAALPKLIAQAQARGLRICPRI